MLSMLPDHHHLFSLQKIETFYYILKPQHTTSKTTANMTFDHTGTNYLFIILPSAFFHASNWLLPWSLVVPIYSVHIGVHKVTRSL